MNNEILAITSSLQKQFGLEDYVLKRNHIHFELTIDGTTNYILSLEWFPPGHIEDLDYNPDGSCVIEVDLHTKALRRVVFVNNISFATLGNYPSSNLEDAIEWIEEVTGLVFGRQFKIVQEEENSYRFEATVDNIDVTPTGTIAIAFNDQNQLTNFSIDGVFPSEDEIEWEPFSLTKDDLLDHIKQHISLVETPLETEEKWVNLWSLQTFYILNDKSTVILPESIYHLPTYITKDIPLEWDKPAFKEYSLEEVDFSTEVTYEDALARKSIAPLTEEEIQVSIIETREILSKQYPNDSGKWILTGMYPEKNYIITEVQTNTTKALKHKVKIIIKREDLTIANFWDSKPILDMFQSYQEPGKTLLEKEKAFEKLVPKIDITPVYVKTANSTTYRLCAKVDCNYVINGTTGELLLL